MLEVVFRPRALAEINSIADYTKAEWGEPQAKRYTEDLRRKIAFIAEFPSADSSQVGLPIGYRKITSGSHRIIYRCTDRELIVVRVIHAGEDVPEIEE
ncbi:MAG: type II toxin-antitoxin system RelE/ParE family toxin [Novosphingobium sp.]|nr:type II toxin-antitoxin system RelE/ParE family toxin [Novosphingobium sp.]MCP5388686.1 type II toxin-antitoxin system RelE/ParE family toxin [Novosphingobium sp.]